MPRDQLLELEAVLAEYVERYGLTERARRYLIEQGTKATAREKRLPVRPMVAPEVSAPIA